jgi:hypothetical protein
LESIVSEYGSFYSESPTSSLLERTLEPQALLRALLSAPPKKYTSTIQFPEPMRPYRGIAFAIVGTSVAIFGLSLSIVGLAFTQVYSGNVNVATPFGAIVAIAGVIIALTSAVSIKE